MRNESLLLLRIVAATAAILSAGCTCGPRARLGAEATGSSSTGAEATVTSGSSTTARPPDVPDDCHPELYGECDPWCQDCPEGEKCLPYADDGGFTWNATRCSPIAPDPKAPGEPCSAPEGPFGGIDDCDKGLMCWNVDPDTYNGTCAAQCRGTPDAPECDDLASFCVIGDEGVLQVCLSWCSPVTLSNCGPGDTCILAGQNLLMASTKPIPYAPETVEFQCILDDDEVGTQGHLCQYVGGCDPGLACVDATLVPGCDPNAAPGCCTAWCSLSAPECPDGTVCTKLLEPHPELPPEFDDLGLCLSP